MALLRANSLLLPADPTMVAGREPNRVNPRLAIYVRRSLSTDTSLSLARQRQVMEDDVVAKGGIYDPASDYFFEDGISAKGTKYRPAVEELLRRVIADEYDGILVWELARFMRNTREARIAAGYMTDHGCELYCHEEPMVTLFGPYRFGFDMVVHAAQGEVEKDSTRMADARRFVASIGGFWGNRAPFGMRKVEGPVGIVEGRSRPLTSLVPDTTPRPELDGMSPAELVLAAARMLIEGASLRTIATTWNRAGYPSSTGKTIWGAGTIRQTLGNPALAGYVVYRGEVMRDGTGELVRSFEQLYDDDTWAEVQAALSVRHAAKPPTRGCNEALLRGLLRCGVCGRRLALSGTGRPYVCKPAVGGKYCLGIAGPKTEAFVVEAAMSLLDDPATLAAQRAAASPATTTTTVDVDAAVDECQRQLEELEAMKLAGEFPGDAGAQRYARHSHRLRDALDEALAAQAAATRRRRTGPLVRLGGPDVRVAFAGLPHYAKRTLLGELIDHIVIGPASGPHGAAPGTFGRRFETDRIRIVWRTAA